MTKDRDDENILIYVACSFVIAKLKEIKFVKIYKKTERSWRFVKKSTRYYLEIQHGINTTTLVCKDEKDTIKKYKIILNKLQLKFGGETK